MPEAARGNKSETRHNPRGGSPHRRTLFHTGVGKTIQQCTGFPSRQHAEAKPPGRPLSAVGLVGPLDSMTRFFQLCRGHLEIVFLHQEIVGIEG